MSVRDLNYRFLVLTLTLSHTQLSHNHCDVAPAVSRNSDRSSGESIELLKEVLAPCHDLR